MKAIIIGRSQDADIVVNDRYVSRIHCQLTIYDNDKISIKDLGSKTGTFVNGKKIFNEYFLRGNDLIKIGLTDFPWQKYAYLQNEPKVERKPEVQEFAKVNNMHANNEISLQNNQYVVFLIAAIAGFVAFFLPWLATASGFDIFQEGLRLHEEKSYILLLYPVSFLVAALAYLRVINNMNPGLLKIIELIPFGLLTFSILRGLSAIGWELPPLDMLLEGFVKIAGVGLIITIASSIILIFSPLINPRGNNF